MQSQDRKSSVSVMLNHVEGYARIKIAVKQNMYETSFTSLKESIYCRFLASELRYTAKNEYEKAFLLKEEIAAMLYSTIKGIKKKRTQE